MPLKKSNSLKRKKKSTLNVARASWFLGLSNLLERRYRKHTLSHIASMAKIFLTGISRTQMRGLKSRISRTRTRGKCLIERCLTLNFPRLKSHPGLPIQKIFETKLLNSLCVPVRPTAGKTPRGGAIKSYARLLKDAYLAKLRRYCRLSHLAKRKMRKRGRSILASWNAWSKRAIRNGKYDGLLNGIFGLKSQDKIAVRHVQATMACKFLRV